MSLNSFPVRSSHFNSRGKQEKEMEQQLYGPWISQLDDNIYDIKK